MVKVYHIGIVAGDMLPYGQYTARKAKTLYLQARRDVDFLSPNLWQYYGRRETTKARLRQNLQGLLAAINQEHGTDYKRLVVE